MQALEMSENVVPQELRDLANRYCEMMASVSSTSSPGLLILNEIHCRR